MANFCYSCGAPLDGAFCDQCGQKNESESYQQTAAAAPPGTPPFQTTPTPQPQAQVQTQPQFQSQAQIQPQPHFQAQPQFQAQTQFLPQFQAQPQANFQPQPQSPSPWTKIQQLSLPVKIAAGAAAAVLIFFAVLYGLYGGQTPEGQLEKFQKAVESKDTKKVMDLITSDATINETSVQKFVEYLNENSSSLKDYSSDKGDPDKLVRADEKKKLFIFQQYKVIIPSVEVKVDIDAKAAILMDGTEVLASTTPGENQLGKFLPGHHTLQAKASFPFGQFSSDEEKIELYANPGQSSNRIFNLSIKAAQAYVMTKSALKNATVTLDGTELATGVDLSSKSVRLNPMPTAAGLPVKISGKLSFGDYTYIESFSTKQTTDSGYYSIESAPTSADNKALLDALAKDIAKFMDAFMSSLNKLDTSSLKDTVDMSDPNGAAIVAESDRIINTYKNSYVFEGQYMGVVLDASTLSISKDEEITIIGKTTYRNNKWKPKGMNLDETNTQVPRFVLKNVNGTLKFIGFYETGKTNLDGKDLVEYKK